MMKLIGNFCETALWGMVAGGESVTTSLPGGLIGLDVDGALWASDTAEGEPLTNEDLRGVLGSRGARLGEAMAYHARWAGAMAGGQPGAHHADLAVVQSGRYLRVPAAERGQRAIQVSLPRGVLAIGPDLDVWRTVGPLLWKPAAPRAGILAPHQAAELLEVVRRRWQGFAQEMVDLWCVPMATPVPESPRFA